MRFLKLTVGLSTLKFSRTFLRCSRFAITTGIAHNIRSRSRKWRTEAKYETVRETSGMSTKAHGLSCVWCWMTTRVGAACKYKSCSTSTQPVSMTTVPKVSCLHGNCHHIHLRELLMPYWHELGRDAPDEHDSWLLVCFTVKKELSCKTNKDRNLFCLFIVQCPLSCSLLLTIR